MIVAKYVSITTSRSVYYTSSFTKCDVVKSFEPVHKTELRDHSKEIHPLIQNLFQ